LALEDLGGSAQMGPQLLAEVERQLLDDLHHYDINGPHLRIDWSEACQEGHCTTYLDGNLESLSGLAVSGPGGEVIADGWFDFIHGGGENPLFVFWLFLSAGGHKLKTEPRIPEHVWRALPEASKRLCARQGVYDAQWSNDPLVRSWRREHAA
jgi:hypothetical protein